MHLLVKLEVMTDETFGLDTEEKVKEAVLTALYEYMPDGVSFNIFSAHALEKVLQQASCGCSTDCK